jgi:hypothetical protein
MRHDPKHCGQTDKSHGEGASSKSLCFILWMKTEDKFVGIAWEAFETLGED